MNKQSLKLYGLIKVNEMNNINFHLLKDKQVQSKITIVIRHAERDKIFDVLDSFETPLVEVGIKKSFMFGANLPKNLSYRISHSIVPRCKQTADYILNGIKAKDDKNRSYIAGVKDFLSGFFLKDVDYILNLVNRIDGYEFIKKWYNEEISNKKIKSFRSSAYMLLSYILAEFNTKENDLIDIHITHDWNLILLQSFVLDIKDNFSWPEYFESVIIEENDSNLILYTNNKSRRFDINDLISQKNNYVI